MRFAQVKAVATVASGNFLEMYDFMLFGYYAPSIAKTFFPAGSEFISLMLTFMTFGVGFLMRPVGALLFGAYIDRKGRRKGLLLTLSLMAVGTLTIAIMPGYDAIGVTAPLLIVLSRLAQGLSAGVEPGGVAIYLSEIAPIDHKGFFVAWKSASQQLAVAFAAVVGVIVTNQLSPEAMVRWGWRIPFFIGCALIPFLILLRRQIDETPAFLTQLHPPTTREVFAALVENWSIVLRGMMLVAMTAVFFYMITAYMPTYGNTVLRLGATESMFIMLCVGVANFFLLPLMGAVSDRIGRFPLLLGAPLLALVTAYPVMRWLVTSPSFVHLLGAELYFALMYGTYHGAMGVFLTEIMPARGRTAGVSIADSLAAGILGGFSPAIAAFLIHATGDLAIPGAWLSVAAVASLGSVLTFALRDRVRQTELRLSK